MLFDIKTLATIDLVIQAVIFIMVLVAAYVAKIKKRLIKHCKIIRVAMVIQLLSVLAMMLPVMVGYLTSPGQAALKNEILVHHSLGVLVVLLWVYISLAVSGRVRVFGRLAWYMRTALMLWTVAFLLGIRLYFRIYLS